MLFGDAFEHVLDTQVWHIFESLHWEIDLTWTYFLTKYSILMVIAAGIILGIYLPLSNKIKTGEAPRGIFWNLFESILTFIRDEVAKPYIGKEADKYVPFLWTIFLFVLVCNLLGMIPFMGSPTASFTVTFTLAFCSYIFINVMTIARHGFKAHIFSFAPHLDMPLALKIPILVLLWPIEFLGLIIKCFVLSVRLFANMFAGHMVLATILLFIPAVVDGTAALFWGVSIASALGVLALSMLELFVAFLQAYLFVFLTALFLGGVLEHAEHYSDEHGHGHDDHGHGHGEHGHGTEHGH
jgi:F-type H+-transporting ATPase subunit a